jgi:hypothetical protein
MAGLVSFVITDPEERRYTARLEAIRSLPILLQDFIKGKE